MKISRHLIESFLNHSCSAEEAKAVADYLINNPKEAEKYIPVDEWDSTSDLSTASREFWEAQWRAIERRRTKSKRVVLQLVKYAAAAMIIFMVGAGLYRFVFLEPADNLSHHQEITNNELQVIVNNQKEKQLVSLPDGSQVELMPASQLSFKENFDENKREINLTGEAVFQVSKDSLRPFTVYSGSISTTALGTKFRVVYSPANGNAEVYLYEGKVVIQAFHENKIQKAFLLPGDALSYGNDEGLLVERRHEIVSGKTPFSNIRKNPKGSTNDAISDLNQNDLQGNAPAIVPMWYRFDKESLSNVFDQLADIYKVKISYRNTDLENKYFIGRFEDTRSLRDILETIAGLNDLKVEKVSASHYIIKKK